LELTKRIAKEWAETEDEVKLYCRQVAKRQLGLYKEILKGWKKDQDVIDVQDEKKEIGKTAPHVAPPMIERMPPLPAAPTSSVANKVRGPPSLPQVAHGTMPPPPQRYPPTQAIHKNIPWHAHPTAHHCNYPAMPVLSPSMEYQEDRRYYPMPGPMRPLDELMYRRMVYGSRSAMVQSATRKRKAEDEPAQPNQDDNKEPHSPPEGGIKESSTFLSPEDPGTSNDANAAITPSPNARSTGTLPQEHLPMKKRRKKMLSGTDEFGVPDESPGSFAASPGYGNESSPNEFSPLNNLSPSEMIMTPNGEAFMGQIMMQNSPWNNESPFPYIDCFSPHEHEGAAPSPPESGPRRGPPPTTMYHQPSMYPNSPYMPQGSHRYPNSYGSPFGPYPTEEDFSDSEALELDDDEMQLMWRRLQATRAKKMRQKHALQQQQGSHDWVAMQSPGPMLQSYTNSFASPVERSEGAKAGKNLSD
jgi:hypothetical protein